VVQDHGGAQADHPARLPLTARHHVLPRFGDWPLAGIDTLAVREWKSTMVAGGLGGKRAGKAMQVLSMVLGSAVEGDRLATNKAAGVKPPKFQRREMLFLDAGQVEQPASELRWYDLRHTAASLLIREGASIKAVQKQMGHPTAATTLDVYGHLFPDELPDLAERMEWLHERAAVRVWPQVAPRCPAPQRRRSVTSTAGAGGGARTLTPLRAQRF
jgi:Phage integrase family